MLMKRLFLIALLLAPLTNLAAQEALTVIPGARVRVFSTLPFSDSSCDPRSLWTCSWERIK